MTEKTEIEINVAESENETVGTPEPTVSEQAAEIVETAVDVAEKMNRGNELEIRIIEHINELRGEIDRRFNELHELTVLIHELTKDKIDDAIDDIVDDTEDIVDDAVHDVETDLVDTVADDVSEAVDIITDDVDDKPKKRERRWL